MTPDTLRLSLCSPRSLGGYGAPAALHRAPPAPSVVRQGDDATDDVMIAIKATSQGGDRRCGGRSEPRAP
jgi:hypothetical protein